jgi:hypothetical protein
MVMSLREDAGAGDFAVLDYLGWTPGQQLPRSVFEKPRQCTAPSASGAKTGAPNHCSTCHLAKR